MKMLVFTGLCIAGGLTAMDVDNSGNMELQKTSLSVESNNLFDENGKQHFRMREKEELQLKDLNKSVESVKSKVPSGAEWISELLEMAHKDKSSTTAGFFNRIDPAILKHDSVETSLELIKKNTPYFTYNWATIKPEVSEFEKMKALNKIYRRSSGMTASYK